MRILVTGANGQVGGALIAPLGAFGTVLPTTRSELDLADVAAIAQSLDRLAPELIVNSGAYTAVDRAEDEKERAFSVNADAPAAMARWAAARHVPLIHFSTDYVFDGSGETPWREDSAPNPLSIYGASKLAGENGVRAAGGAHLIVRTSWVYAAKGTNFLRTIALLARKRTELRIVADQIGAPTTARVVADTVAGILSTNVTDLPGTFARSAGIVNLVCSGTASWYEFGGAIVEGLRSRGVALAAERMVPIATIDYPTQARRPSNSRLDLSRLRQVFGLDTPEWKDALEVELDALARELA
ncbi:dTDP-4-dehydrorhamnose reductase [Xanthobacteraceae bacterium Astr-EGSB]|uniref:dTDP-4-dehydrorhamnose reductase n=1 Tax=Astrobacterium formosum TaxID=3069710 RepID=UPI0027B2A350|nr:dTDP-4-dehydrorhamnose reductase [Xanthobacteraceae bacterium Astr-EGSB]